MEELSPGGILRFGLIEAPQAGALFVRVAADGRPAGVARDLGAALARAAGASAAFPVFPASGALTEALAAGTADAGFMPEDAARRALVRFGPALFQIESTYLVRAGSEATDVAEVDRPGIRVVGVAGTTTIRAAARTLRHTEPAAAPSVTDAIARFSRGEADALALSRDSLAPVAAAHPGSRITAGAFQRTAVALALPPGRPAALAFASAWLDGAKRDGTVRRLLDAHGLASVRIAGEAEAAPG